MHGCESPLLCFLLIACHLWKMSHQVDCGTANFHSCVLAIHITFWDNQSTGGMWGGDATSSLLAYPITFWDSKSAGELPLC
ncbi:hypothetical protein T4E_5683 [Trichinella pseudospiralis]|uniref:Secreted protein n=1 Tax=Trichinella pseudospiralis TaxID=6337 RepID=A0A0V0XZ28_TRIPS|nr:hypothetical protein T4E_5683 [Trichinella pseudospiralis]